MKKLFLLFIIFFTVSAAAQNIDRKQLLKDLEILSSDVYEGRKTGSRENQMAANYIVSQFKDIGLSFYQDSFKHPFSFKNRNSDLVNATNLIGYIKGKTEKVILISAHYDHVGIKKSLIYNGADDNASGVAGLLALAKYFKSRPPENTLLFIAFDAEEMGLKGAYSFLNNPVLDNTRIKMMINMDMISHNNKKELYAVGTFKNPILKKIIKDADINTGVRILYGHDNPKLGKDDWTMQSDQGPFAQNNIPFIYFGVEDHPDYHQPTDEYQNINPNFFYGATNAILNSIIKVDHQLNKLVKK
ncbi:MAG: M28 family peptidase [Flavobacterium sp.]|nr:M28 family peptidase [Pedobacter sp.]